MKYSGYIGIIAALALVGCCFLPWVYIASVNTTVTGFHTAGTYFGKPGLFHVFCCAVAVVLFLLNKIWAKRLNVLVCTLNFAWAVRNFIIISHCEMGECPEKKLPLYGVLLFAAVVMLMSLLPAVKASPNAV